MGEKFFRGINEEKQSYVKVGGKLLKKKNKQLLKKKILGCHFKELLSSHQQAQELIFL